MSFKIKNICFNTDCYLGFPTLAVIANNYSNIQVEAIDISEHRINKWNSTN